MKRIGIALMAVVLAGCSGRSPVAPASTQQVAEAAVESSTISGQVYAAVDWGDPPIADALVEVTDTDGTTTTVLSDKNGFYQISVRSGGVSITASQEGYEAKTWQIKLHDDLVLNFSLTPR